MLGIENLKKAVKFAIDLGEQFATSLADGFQWTDSFSFVDELIQVPGLLKSGKDVVAELKDLDATERQELYDYIKEEFDIADDKVEDVVEQALATAVSVLLLVDKVKALKK
jgi:hypothetical protein